MKKRFRTKPAVLLLVATTALRAAVPAMASTLSFSLTRDDCTGTCGTASPFATVTITDAGMGSSSYVNITETLPAGERYAGTGAGAALDFQLNFAGLITMTSLPTGFAAGSGSTTASGLGSFSQYVICSTCQGGKSTNPAGPLSFSVSSAFGPVTTALFAPNSSGYSFASDIVGNNGNTGNVAASLAGALTGGSVIITPTPEPASLVLELSGLVAGALYYRRKRRLQPLDQTLWQFMPDQERR